jgi:hypothetical protein
LRENAMVEWHEAARHLNGSAERLIHTIDSSENGVHQRTLNFAGGQQLEQTLERFRRDLLSRTAEEYRN